jgi:hypothetical protein
MRFGALPCLQALLDEKASRYFVEPMDLTGLRDVVRSPAKLVGLRWSDEALPDDIIQDARGEPGALPLIENLLRLLWQKREDKVLSRNVYKELGGVGGALAGSADALLESLGKEKENALRLLTALVKVGQETQDTRRTITKAIALKAAGGGEQADKILDQLSGLRGPETPRGAAARPRLIVISNGSKDEPTDLVDLAHETLLRYNRHDQPYWKTLRDRITAERKRLEDRELLEVLAKSWDDRGRPRDGLATRAQLKAFEQLRDVSDRANRFVEASKSSLRTIEWSITALASIMMLVASFTWWLNSNDMTLRLSWLMLLARPGYTHVPEMVKIEPKEFQMGDVQGDGNAEERPVRKVHIRSRSPLANTKSCLTSMTFLPGSKVENVLPISDGAVVAAR